MVADPTLQMAGLRWMDAGGLTCENETLLYHRTAVGPAEIGAL